MMSIRALCCENQDILIISCIPHRLLMLPPPIMLLYMPKSALRVETLRRYRLALHTDQLNKTEILFAIDLDLYHQFLVSPSWVLLTLVEFSALLRQPSHSDQSLASDSSPIPKIRWCLKCSPTQ